MRPGFNPWVGKISWRRKRQPTPVFLPGKSHGQRSLVGYSPWGRKELDTTERLHFSLSVYLKIMFNSSASCISTPLFHKDKSKMKEQDAGKKSWVNSFHMVNCAIFHLIPTKCQGPLCGFPQQPFEDCKEIKPIEDCKEIKSPKFFLAHPVNQEPPPTIIPILQVYTTTLTLNSAGDPHRQDFRPLCPRPGQLLSLVSETVYPVGWTSPFMAVS